MVRKAYFGTACSLLLTLLLLGPGTAFPQADLEDTELGQPAPAEPQDAVPDEPSPSPQLPSDGEDAEVPERFEREIDPIPGTETSPGQQAPVDDAVEEAGPPAEPRPDAFEEIANLRTEFDTRLRTLEMRVQQQLERVDELQQRVATLTEVPGPTGSETADSQEEVADADPVGDSGDADPSELQRLRAELETLRAEYAELSVAVSDHAKEIDNHTASLDSHTQSISALSQEQSATSDAVNIVKSDQEKLALQLRDAVASSGDGSGTGVLGTMQPGAVQYRMRIHNTTGVEQPITVNGVQWLVRADEWTYVPVPYGPITVHKSGHAPLEIVEQASQWQRDDRGFYVAYDLGNHQLEAAAGE
jgi:hypothetical protein